MGLITLDELRKVDGGRYELSVAPKTVCQPGEFKFAAVNFEHGHLYGMVDSLVRAGAELKWIFDNDAERLVKLAEKYPSAKVARCLDEILDDAEVRLVASADIPNLRGPLAVKVMKAGKDYYTDKTPFTSMEHLVEAKETQKATGQKFWVYYSERLCSEAAMLAGDLITQGAVGKVMQVMGWGPHRMGAPSSRPGWFFRRKQYGGILCDIGSHQCEQFLQYTGAKDAKINFARVFNYGHPDYPEFEDFGEASLIADNGTSFYFRCDWFTPDGLHTWGDGRTLIIGTEGYMELRKFIDVGTENGGNQLYFADKKNEVHINCNGTIGLRFFGQLIRDSLDRTDLAMDQEHTFKAAELCLKCQQYADATKFANA